MKVINIVLLATALQCSGTAAGPVGTLYRALKRLMKIRKTYQEAKEQINPTVAWATMNPTGMADDSSQLEVIRDQVRDAQHHVRCVYLGVALNHMRLTNVLLFDKTHLSWLVKNTAEVDFRDEAATILAMLHNVSESGVTADVMWIFFMYAQRMAEYVETARASQKQRAFYAAAHKAAFEFFQREFGPIDKCETYGLVNKEVEKMKDSSTNLERRLELIRENKKFITDQTHVRGEDDDDDDDASIISTAGKEHVTIKALRLNDMLDDYTITNTLFRQFKLGVDWTKIEYLVQGQYNMGKMSSYPISSQIQALGALHADMIGILKVVMFRIAWKHTKYASTFNFSRVLRFATDLEEKDLYAAHEKNYAIMCNCLRDFARQLGIANDYDVQNVIAVFARNQPSVSLRRTFNWEKWVLTRALKRSLRKLHRGRSLNVLVLDRRYRIEVIDRMQKLVKDYGLKLTESTQESVVSAQVFTEYISKILHGVNFPKVINSFIRVQVSPKLKSLDFFERKYMGETKYKKNKKIIK